MNQSAAEILQALHDKYPIQVTDAMMQSNHLRRVVQAYIDDPEINAGNAAHHLTFFLQSFHYMAPLIYKETRVPYSIDREAAIEEIRNAARHVSTDNSNYGEVISGTREQLERMRQEDPSIMDLSRPENLEKLAEKDLLHIALMQVADALETLTDVQVTPGMLHSTPFDALHLNPSILKTRGKAHKPERAINGLLTREINTLIPPSITKNRPALIADLAALIDSELDANSINVSLLREK